jgi:hypothetical protein
MQSLFQPIMWGILEGTVWARGGSYISIRVCTASSLGQNRLIPSPHTVTISFQRLRDAEMTTSQRRLGAEVQVKSGAPAQLLIDVRSAPADPLAVSSLIQLMQMYRTRT